jgi:hypothetical protein
LKETNRMDNSEISSPAILIAILGSELELAMVDGPLSSGFTQGDCFYRDAGQGDFTGFYDWLRDTAGRLLGLKYWIYRDVDFHREVLASLPYVELPDGEPSVEIFFSAERGYDAAKSDDQSFADNALFRSEDGEWAVTFSVYALDRDELACLRSCQSKWVIVHPTG